MPECDQWPTPLVVARGATMGVNRLSGQAWYRARAWCMSQPPVCWRCGKAVRWDLPQHHPDRATIGHTVPVADHPEALTDPACMRPECWDCNHRAGRDQHFQPRSVASVPPPSRQWR